MCETGDRFPFYGIKVSSIASDVIPQNATSTMIWCCCVCLEKFHREMEKKIKITSDAPNNESGLTQTITIGKSICLKRVNILIYITDFVCFESLKLHYTVVTFQTIFLLAVLMFRFFYVPFIVGSHFQ